MKLRAVGAAERAAIVLRDQIDGVWLAFHCGELGKATAAVMQALYLVLADQINKDSDSEAVVWFWSLPSTEERATVIGAGICSADIKLGTQGRRCIWRESLGDVRQAPDSTER
jgi:hypothetical protein